MLPTTSSKITLHCYAYKGNYSFKAHTVQLHYSTIGQKKFTQPWCYLSIQFLLDFGAEQTLLELPMASHFGGRNLGQRTLWLSAGSERMELPGMIWGHGGQIHAQKVRGIYFTGSPVNLRIDTRVQLDRSGSYLLPSVSDGIRGIKGMNAEFRASFKRRVTGRPPQSQSEIDRLASVPLLDCALM